MCSNRLFGTVVFLSLLHSVSIGQVKDYYAVLDFQATGISQNEALSLCNLLRAELVSTGKINLVERGAMQQILAEQDFQLSGCSSSECATEIGQLLGVSKIITGSVGKIGSTYTVVTQVIDVTSGAIISSYTRTRKGAIDNLIEDIFALAWEISEVNTKTDVRENSFPDNPVRTPAQRPTATTPIVKTVPVAKKSKSSWAEKKEANFWGISSGGGSFSGRDLSGLFNGTRIFTIDYMILGKGMGSAIGFWALSAETSSGVATISQTGFYLDVLPMLNFDLSPLLVTAYGGVGICYQTTRMDAESIGDATNKGWGFDWVVGAQLSLGKMLGVYTENRGLSSKAGKLAVGSGWICIGLRITGDLF